MNDNLSFIIINHMAPTYRQMGKWGRWSSDSDKTRVQFTPGPSDFSGHGTNPTCASSHTGVKWVPVRVWVNESGCSKRQSVNDQLTYNPMSMEIYLKRGLYKCGILFYYLSGLKTNVSPSCTWLILYFAKPNKWQDI